MEESKPFLPIPFLPAVSPAVQRFRCISTRVWYKFPRLNIAHFTTFVATSMVWGCMLLFIIYTSPDIFQSASQNLTSQPTARTGFLATEIDYLTCGDSLQEAKERGCVYDILSNAWIPGVCADEASVKEYQADESWFPFADLNRTESLTREELGDREFYYTSVRDHIVHCAVLWRRQFRALTESWKYVDSVLMGPVHTRHCSQYLVDLTERGPDFRSIPIKVIVGHEGCHVRGTQL